MVYRSWVTLIDERGMVDDARPRRKAVKVLLAGLLLLSLAACGGNGDANNVSTTRTRTQTASPTPTPNPTCVAVAGLTDCQGDSDCVVVDRIGCCPCNMGGQQGAINQGKGAQLFSQLEACCMVACPAVVLCESNLVAVCQHGTCMLATATATPTQTMTPTPTSLSAVTYRLTQGSTILSSPAPPGNNTQTLKEPLSGTFVVVPQPPGPPYCRNTLLCLAVSTFEFRSVHFTVTGSTGEIYQTTFEPDLVFMDFTGFVNNQPFSLGGTGAFDAGSPYPPPFAALEICGAPPGVGGSCEGIRAGTDVGYDLIISATAD